MTTLVDAKCVKRALTRTPQREADAYAPTRMPHGEAAPSGRTCMRTPTRTPHAGAHGHGEQAKDSYCEEMRLTNVSARGPRLEPRRGEVVVRTLAAALNARDLQIAGGSYVAAFRLPFVPLGDD